MVAASAGYDRILSMSKSLPDRQHAVKEGGSGRSAAGDAFSELVVQAFRLDGLLTAAGDALAEPAGQTTARWRVLAAVEEAPMTVAQIARAWGLARQSVQRVADGLAADGLIAYDNNPAHRRAHLLRLTAKGRARLRQIQTAQRRWANDLGEQIGAEKLHRANRLIAEVIKALIETRARE
jgi:DNA-binding MarR family transcriptional regulator